MLAHVLASRGAQAAIVVYDITNQVSGLEKIVLAFIYRN